MINLLNCLKLAFCFFFTKPDDITLLVNYVNKLSVAKREIAEKVGILTKK